MAPSSSQEHGIAREAYDCVKFLYIYSRSPECTENSIATGVLGTCSLPKPESWLGWTWKCVRDLHWPSGSGGSSPAHLCVFVPSCRRGEEKKGAPRSECQATLHTFGRCRCAIEYLLTARCSRIYSNISVDISPGLQIYIILFPFIFIYCSLV